MKFHPIVAIFFAFACFLSACAGPQVEAPPSHPIDGATPVSAVAEDSPQLAQIATIERQTIAARGLQERQPIEKRLIGRDEAARFIASELERDRTEIDRRGAVYKLLDLIPENADLFTLQRDLLISQVQGYDDSRTQNAQCHHDICRDRQ